MFLFLHAQVCVVLPLVEIKTFALQFEKKGGEGDALFSSLYLVLQNTKSIFN